jgi:hypothetical protein
MEEQECIIGYKHRPCDVKLTISKLYQTINCLINRHKDEEELDEIIKSIEWYNYCPECGKKLVPPDVNKMIDSVKYPPNQEYILLASGHIDPITKEIIWDE